jgi:hypothetical protein
VIAKASLNTSVSVGKKKRTLWSEVDVSGGDGKRAKGGTLAINIREEDGEGPREASNAG